MSDIDQRLIDYSEEYSAKKIYNKPDHFEYLTPCGHLVVCPFSGLVLIVRDELKENNK